MPSRKTKESGVTGSAMWDERLRHFERQRERMVETIREFVEIESPSDNKPAADRMAIFLAAKFEARGGRCRLHRARDFGDNLQIDFEGSSGAQSAKRKPVLLLGHYDTVYPLGTLASMPCKLDQGRLHGPGVLDMKSGIALIFHAIEAPANLARRTPEASHGFSGLRRRSG